MAKTVARYAAAILALSTLAAVPYTRSLVDHFRGHSGLLLPIFLPVAGCVVWYYYRTFRRLGAPHTTIVWWLTSLTLLFLSVIPFTVAPEESIHVLTYGGMSAVLVFCWPKEWGVLRSVVISLLLANILSVLDEAYQGITPRRVFDTRDLLFNLYGTLWGILAVIPFKKRGGGN